MELEKSHEEAMHRGLKIRFGASNYVKMIDNLSVKMSKFVNNRKEEIISIFTTKTPDELISVSCLITSKLDEENSDFIHDLRLYSNAFSELHPNQQMHFSDQALKQYHDEVAEYCRRVY